MTDKRVANMKMYIVMSTIEIRRLKRYCFFLVLLLVASIAFNLACIFTHIMGGNECTTTEEQHAPAYLEPSEKNLTISSTKAIFCPKNRRSSC